MQGGDKSVAFNEMAQKYQNTVSLESLDLESLIVLAAAEFRMTFLFIDGLDECNDLNSLLPKLSVLRSHIRLLVMSRDRRDIRQAMVKCPSISLGSHTMEQDIRHFVNVEVRKRVASGSLKADDPLKADIANTLCTGANGM
jgi:hypothetical protein